MPEWAGRPANQHCLWALEQGYNGPVHGARQSVTVWAVPSAGERNASVLRDDFGPTSDVDVLVEFEPGHVPGFFGLHRIECAIATLFGDRRVDLLTFRSLNPHLRDRILSEAEVQYAA